MFLYNLWLDMRAEGREASPRRCCSITISTSCSASCAISSPTASRAIWVDNEEAYESVLRFVQRFQPALVGRVKLYTRDAPDLRRVRHHRRAREGAAAEGLAEVRRLHRHQPDRSAGGHRHQHRQVRRQVESPGRHHRQDQHRRHQGDRPADPPARSGRHHRGRLHRHGRAQESPEGDAGARRSHARRSRAVQDSPVQRFRTGGDHPQAREADPGADAVLAVPVLRRRGLREERRRPWSARSCRKRTRWPRAWKART